MRLNPSQSEILGQVITLLKTALRFSQNEIATRIGVSSAVFSKLKTGWATSQTMYQQILASLEQMASKQDPETASQVQEKINLLRQLGSEPDPLNLSAADIRDEELKKSYRMLHTRCCIDPDLVHGIHFSRLWVVSSTYDIQGLDSFYDRTRQIVDEMAKQSRLQTINLSGVTDYRRVINSSFALTMPALQLFPFYLTVDRRPFWGVIPYGRQVRLGIAISTPMLAASQLKNAEQLHRNDVMQLVECSVNIHNVAPYSALQILWEMIARVADGRMLTQFTQLCRPDWPTFDAAVAHLQDHQPWEMLNHNALIYDLGETEIVEMLLAKAGLDDFVTREIVHGVNVPAGIGYSLQTLPWIAKKERFETIKSNVVTLLQPLRMEFHRVGIELVA